jgi:RING finger family protein
MNNDFNNSIDYYNNFNISKNAIIIYKNNNLNYISYDQYMNFYYLFENRYRNNVNLNKSIIHKNKKIYLITFKGIKLIESVNIYIKYIIIYENIKNQEILNDIKNEQTKTINYLKSKNNKLNDIINGHIDTINYLKKYIKKLQNNKFDNTCCICLENINTISSKKTLECEHYFHKNCINIVENHKCPLCNQISLRF